jgi:gentisate 1,2-dioxygenase
MPVNYRPESSTSPIFNYPYARTREALFQLARTGEIDPHHGICLRYVNPVNGDWVMPTLGPTMRLLPAGFSTEKYRSTDSAVLVVLEGAAEIVVDGRPSEILRENDVFSMPGWSPYTIRATEGDCVIFSFSDRPVHEKLGLFREEKH